MFENDRVSAWNEVYRGNCILAGAHYDSLDEALTVGKKIIMTLRSPVDRIISYYNYMQTFTLNDFFKKQDAAGVSIYDLSFNEFIESKNPLLVAAHSNYFLRILFGDAYQNLIDTSSEDQLIRRIDEKLSFITCFLRYENLFSDLSLMSKILGIPEIVYLYNEKRKIDRSPNENDVSIDSLDAQLLTRLYDQNALDMIFISRVNEYVDSLERKARTIEPWILPDIRLPLLRVGMDRAITHREIDCRSMFVRGWHHLEHDGIWSRGNRSCIALNLSPEVTSIEIDFSLPNYTELDSANICISIIGTEKKQYSLFLKNGINRFLPPQSVPTRIISVAEFGRFSIMLSVPENANRSKFMIEIESDFSFVPSLVYNDVYDDRELAFKLHTIKAH
jgi:hypothetical protein